MKSKKKNIKNNLSSNKKTSKKLPSIILSSNCRTNYKLIKYINNIINKKIRPHDTNEKVKISMIITAKLGFKHKSRNELKQEAINKCNKWGYEKKLNAQLEFIDCSNKNNLQRFKNSIKKNNIIWLLGGDTFYLTYYLKKYKMDKLICNKIKNNKKALLIGCCAGAIVAGNSIHSTYISRFNKRSKKYNYNFQTKYFSKKKNMKGLKLINKTFLPHCTSKNKNFILKKQRIYCLPELKPYIK
jgi:cyanophycinase-like exopeptidase